MPADVFHSAVLNQTLDVVVGSCRPGSDVYEVSLVADSPTNRPLMDTLTRAGLRNVTGEAGEGKWQRVVANNNRNLSGGGGRGAGRLLILRLLEHSASRAQIPLVLWTGALEDLTQLAQTRPARHNSIHWSHTGPRG